MTVEELNQIAALHKNAFSKDHFSSALPQNLLKEFYRTLLEKNEFCYVAKIDNQIVGFIIAGENTAKAVKEFTNKYLFDVIIIMLCHPRFIFQKINSFINNKPFSSSAKIRLLSIAIDHKLKGTGVGKFMIGSFEAKLREQGFELYGLSVKKSNTNAIEFYKRTNFVEENVTDDAIYYIKSL